MYPKSKHTTFKCLMKCWSRSLDSYRIWNMDMDLRYVSVVCQCNVYCRVYGRSIFSRMYFISVFPSEIYVAVCTAGACFPGYFSVVYIPVKYMFQDILQEFEKCVSQMEADMDTANAPLRQQKRRRRKRSKSKFLSPSLLLAESIHHSRQAFSTQLGYA